MARKHDDDAELGTNTNENYHKLRNKDSGTGASVVTPDVDDMRVDWTTMEYNHGKLSRVLSGARSRRYTGGKNSHRMHVLMEETMASLSSFWNPTPRSSHTQLTKLLLATPLPHTTAKMLVASGHVLKIPDHRPFDAYENKLLLRALSDTWNAGELDCIPWCNVH